MAALTTQASTLLSTLISSSSGASPEPNSMETDQWMQSTSTQLMPDAQTKSSGMVIADELHFVMSAIVGPIFCFLGLAGNVLSIVVWNRHAMKSSTGRYLTGQAVADFFVLFFFLVCDSVTHWAPAVTKSVSYGRFFSYFGYPFFFLAVICSIWFTVGVTADRYIMVCWIAKAKHYCNEKRANLGLFLITGSCFLINLPHFASHKSVDPELEVNATISFPKTEFGGGEGGKFYEFWIHCIFLVLVPWFAVLVMNMMIIKKIGESNQKMADVKSKQSIKKSKESENQITRLLLTVTFTFLFFIGIQCVVQCFFMLQPDGADKALVSGSFAIAKLGIVFNSSLNFVFYCLSGKRFRRELANMLHLTRKDVTLTSLVDTPSTGTTSGIANSSSTTGM